METRGKKIGQMNKLPDIEEVIKYMKEFSNTVVAEHFGVSRQCIDQHRHTHKIGAPNNPRVCYKPPLMTEDQFVKALRLKKEGLTWNEVSKKVGLKATYLNLKFWEKGYRYHDFPHPRKIKKKKEYQRTVKLLDKGWKCIEISKKLKVNYQTIIWWKNLHIGKIK